MLIDPNYHEIVPDADGVPLAGADAAVALVALAAGAGADPGVSFGIGDKATSEKEVGARQMRQSASLRGGQGCLFFAILHKDAFLQGFSATGHTSADNPVLSICDT